MSYTRKNTLNAEVFSYAIFFLLVHKSWPKVSTVNSQGRSNQHSIFLCIRTVEFLTSLVRVSAFLESKRENMLGELPNDPLNSFLPFDSVPP